MTMSRHLRARSLVAQPHTLLSNRHRSLSSTTHHYRTGTVAASLISMPMLLRATINTRHRLPDKITNTIDPLTGVITIRLTKRRIGILRIHDSSMKHILDGLIIIYKSTMNRLRHQFAIRPNQARVTAVPLRRLLIGLGTTVGVRTKPCIAEITMHRNKKQCCL